MSDDKVLLDALAESERLREIDGRTIDELRLENARLIADAKRREREAFDVGAHMEGGGDWDWEEYIVAEANRRYGEEVKA